MARGDGSGQDSFEHVRKITEDLLIANPDDAVAELRDVVVTEGILIGLEVMDVSVNFDDEFAR